MEKNKEDDENHLVEEQNRKMVYYYQKMRKYSKTYFGEKKYRKISFSVMLVYFFGSLKI